MLTYPSDHNWKYYGLSGQGAIRKRFLRVERFHRGPFLFGKRFKNIKWTVSTVERQLTYPEDNPKGNNAYTKDGSAEDDINMEDGSGKARFQYGGW